MASTKDTAVNLFIADVLSDVIADALTKWARSKVGVGAVGGQAVVTARDKTKIKVETPTHTYIVSIS